MALAVLLPLRVLLELASGDVGATLVLVLLTIVGTILVQGALVELVQDEHEARPPRSLARLYGDTIGRVLPLLGLSLLVGIGVGLGFLLLVVPGVILWTRWSVAVPALVLEGRGVTGSMRRSWELVGGRGWAVWRLFLRVAFLTGLTQIALVLATTALSGGHPTRLVAFLTGFAASALTTPFGAHALNATYYRLAEPERPVIADEPREGWRTVWQEQDANESWEDTRSRLESGREYL